jgi:hypothetical protein
MPLEFLVQEYNEKLINNYRHFHELNSNALRLMTELQDDITQVLARTKPHHQSTFLETYRELHSTLEQMIPYTANVMYNPENEEDRFSLWNAPWWHRDFKKALEKLDAQVKPALEQLDMYCRIGYQSPIKDARGDVRGQSNSNLQKIHDAFKYDLSGNSKKDASGLDTFEELLRKMHEMYYVMLNECIEEGRPTNYGGGGNVLVPYFTSQEGVNPHMQNILDLINKLDQYNQKANQKAAKEWSYREGVETGLMHKLLGRYFTDETATFSMRESFASDEKVYVHIRHDPPKERYIVRWELGTKGNIWVDDRDNYAEIFEKEGWAFDKDIWHEKDIQAQKSVTEEDLERTIVTAFILTEHEAGNLRSHRVKKPANMLNFINAFYTGFKADDADALKPFEKFNQFEPED